MENCAEMLRALGFRRLISLENFRRPNFPLVAEILGWLVHRFEPNADLPTHTDTEQDRAAKANVRLNTKRLYQADGYAVQEILKGLSLLYSAMPNNKDDSGFDDDSETTLNFDVSNKISELKHIRSLASEISSRGATLYDLLRREVDLREIRTNIINRQLELTEVEEGMQSAISACEREGKPNQTAIENVGSDQSNLEAKIDKKKTGLERGQKRLLTLKKVRRVLIVSCLSLFLVPDVHHRMSLTVPSTRRVPHRIMSLNALVPDVSLIVSCLSLFLVPDVSIIVSCLSLS
ncbi:Clusterin-associated protein 1-like 1 [Homarus americanus]|uniref:Clusterin-associated protein 1-like 1 n=1 Tax=Homarus americanus TaxID=6706 RepID=A0A8J5JNA5_HOMAM|nr:Clusterin-associated protein 1-like 1 [Homarus americanus]